jgi:DNA polymerase I
MNLMFKRRIYHPAWMRLNQRIMNLLEKHFNISSPKQLGEILFEKLNLPYGKKTKTGYSTNVEVLNELDETPPNY